MFYVLFYICFCFQVTNCNCCAFLSIRLCVYGWRLNYIGSPNTSRYKSVWSSFTFFMAFSNYLDIFIVSLWWNCPALFPQDTKTCFYNICWPLTPSHHPDVLHPAHHTTSEHHICIVENELPNQSCSSRWCGSPTLVPVVEAQLIVKNLICSWSVPWSSALPPPTTPRPAQQGGP